MKPIIETGPEQSPTPSTTRQGAESSGWLGKSAAFLGLVLVAVIGFGSSSGWFDGWLKKTPAVNELTDSESAADKPAAGDAGLAAPSPPPVAPAVQILPPLDPTLPTDSKQLLDEGKRVAQHLVDTLPNSIDAREMQARFEYEFGETTKAEELWKQIIAVNPGYVYALKGLGDVNSLNGNLQEAVGYYRRGVLADPSDLSLQNLLGIALLDSSQFEEAKRTFEAILARDPSRVDARVELSSVLVQLHDFEGAKGHLEIALKAFPELPEIHFGLANAYTRLGDQEKAKFHRAEHQKYRKNSESLREKGRRDYDDLEALKIDIGKLYLGMAQTYLSNQMADAAGLLLLRISRMNVTDPECRRALAFMAVSQGKTFDGIRWLTEVAELTPDDFSIVKEIARLHLQTRQPQAAEKLLLSFMQNHPKNLEATREMVSYFTQVQRDEKRAVQYGMESCEISPTAENYAMLASVYDAFERLEEAIAALARAVELQPNNASYQQGLALLRDEVAKQNAGAGKTAGNDAPRNPTEATTPK